MVFKTVEGLKDAVSAEEHTVKGKKVDNSFEESTERKLLTTLSKGGSEEGTGEAGQSVCGEAEG